MLKAKSLKELVFKELLRAEIQGECIICTKRKTNPKGYLSLTWEGHTTYLHRIVACIFANISLNTNLEAHHKCKNKRCINSNHLELVTKYQHRNIHPNATKRFCNYGHDTLITGRYSSNNCIACAKANYKKSLNCIE
jgi:hypothetical protein